jgi:hypothetical protein
MTTLITSGEELSSGLPTKATILLWLLSGLLPVSTGFAQQPTEAASVPAAAGLVVDAVTGAALARAVVAVTAPSDTTTLVSRVTDAEGRFTIPTLPSGRYHVMFSLEGYGAVVRELTILAGAAAAVDMDTVLLRPDGAEVGGPRVVASASHRGFASLPRWSRRARRLDDLGAPPVS